jgi:hypothetical protein
MLDCCETTRWDIQKPIPLLYKLCTRSKASTCHASEADRGVLPGNFPESITQARPGLALGAIPICPLQTQTAYGVAGLCRYK